MVLFNLLLLASAQAHVQLRVSNAREDGEGGCGTWWMLQAILAFSSQGCMHLWFYVALCSVPISTLGRRHAVVFDPSLFLGWLLYVVSVVVICAHALLTELLEHQLALHNKGCVMAWVRSMLLHYSV